MERQFSRRKFMLGCTAASIASQLPFEAYSKERAESFAKKRTNDDEASTLARALDHNHYMQLAIEQAKNVPTCPFGAVVVNVRTGKVVGQGYVKLNKNPIWHGEMDAINSCPDVSAGFDWKEVCLYTTGESCPMCQSAIIWTGMPLVVYGSSMPTLQRYKFGEINIRAKTVIAASLKGKCEIIGGVLEKECNELFRKASAGA